MNEFNTNNIKLKIQTDSSELLPLFQIYIK